jgi:hypothetical protein
MYADTDAHLASQLNAQARERTGIVDQAVASDPGER